MDQVGVFCGAFGHVPQDEPVVGVVVIGVKLTVVDFATGPACG